MNAEDITAPPSRAGILGKSLLVSSVPPSGCIPAMAESAAAGACLLSLSLGVWTGGFCGGWSCPTETPRNPANSNTRTKEGRMLITATTESQPYHRLADGYSDPDFGL